MVALPKWVERFTRKPRHRLNTWKAKLKTGWRKNVYAWWPLWVGVLGVVILLVLGLLTWFTQDRRSFWSNVVAETVGILAAFAIAWFSIEKRFQRQADRITEGVKRRLNHVRSEASLIVTAITTASDNNPTIGSGQGGSGYVEQNFEDLANLLERSASKCAWNVPREPRGLYMLFEREGRLSTVIDRTIRLYGAALVEYPELLNTFERYESAYSSEGDRWEQFWQANREIQNRRQAILEHSSGEEVPEIPIAPHEARDNLRKLAAYSLDVIAAVTRVLKDWDSVPSLAWNPLAPRALWGWVYRSNDVRAMWDVR